MVSRRVVKIAEFSVAPIGEGTSLSMYVAEVLRLLKNMEGLRLQLTPMGTILESESLETILRAVSVAHESLFKMGVKRIVSTLRIDDRRDKPRMMEDKVKEVEKRLAG